MGIHSTARCRLARVSVELERCQWQVIPRCTRKANKSEVKITSAKTTTRRALLGLRPLQGGRSRGLGADLNGKKTTRPLRPEQNAAERSRAQTVFCTALYTDAGNTGAAFPFPRCGGFGAKSLASPRRKKYPGTRKLKATSKRGKSGSELVEPSS